MIAGTVIAEVYPHGDTVLRVVGRDTSQAVMVAHTIPKEGTKLHFPRLTGWWLSPEEILDYRSPVDRAFVVPNIDPEEALALLDYLTNTER